MSGAKFAAIKQATSQIPSNFNHLGSLRCFGLALDGVVGVCGSYVATVSRVPRDPQLHCLAGILVLFTGSDPASQTDATVALINAPTGSTAVLYLAS